MTCAYINKLFLKKTPVKYKCTLKRIVGFYHSYKFKTKYSRWIVESIHNYFSKQNVSEKLINPQVTK